MDRGGEITDGDSREDKLAIFFRLCFSPFLDIYNGRESGERFTIRS